MGYCRQTKDTFQTSYRHQQIQAITRHQVWFLSNHNSHIPMNHEQINRIVHEVFEKAKKGSISHSKYALAKQVVKEIHHLNPKTLERAYSRYIEKNETISTPNPDTIQFLCKYIGYTDYEDYVSKKTTPNIMTINN